MVRIILLTVIFTGAAWICPGFAAGPEPSRVPVLSPLFETCLQCHADVADASAESYVHAPFRDGECVDCHDPHVSDKPGLLWKDLGARCLRCHAAKLDGIAPNDLHTPVRKGDCQGCHRGHASSGPGLLAKRGPDLCSACHAGLREAAGEPVVHAVFENGRCDECHDPHAAFTPPFRDGGSRGCLACHPADEGDMTQAHDGLVTGESACLECHVAHASGNAGLLHPSAHEPVLEGACEACHAGESPAEPVGAVGVDCLECHAQMAPAGEDQGGHAKLLTGKCTACHMPHASRNPTLLRSGARDLCLGCHPGVQRQLVAESVHAPVRDGDCAACHTAHSSTQATMLPAPESELCRSCHTDDTHKLAHPFGGQWVNPRTGKRKDIIDPRTGGILGCLSCHVPHGSPHEALLTHSGGRSLCLQCHSL